MTPFQIAQRSPGLTAIGVLAALTLIEYIVSVTDVVGAFTLLAVIAVAKAVIILISFMHLKNLWEKEA